MEILLFSFKERRYDSRKRFR